MKIDAQNKPEYLYKLLSVMKYDQGLKNKIMYGTMFHLRILQIIHGTQVLQSTIECDCDVVGAI